MGLFRGERRGDAALLEPSFTQSLTYCTRRGLAGMSLSACFAGPSFNLLIGLSCGFLAQKEALLSDEGLSIPMGMPTVKLGFIMLLFNALGFIMISVYNGGVIHKSQGYVFWATYLIYITLSAQHMY